MTLTNAIEEEYASGDEVGLVLTTTEIDHPSFEAPIRMVAGIDHPDPDFVAMLPIEDGGVPVAHIPCGFSITPPGSDKDGPTEGKVQVDNVSGLLREPLKAASGYGEPLSVTIRQYVVQPGGLANVTGPDEEYTGLQLRNVSLKSTTAEGVIAWPDGRKFNVPTGPNAFFDRFNYPALF